MSEPCVKSVIAAGVPNCFEDKGIAAQAAGHRITTALKATFVWLADQPRFRSRLRYSDANYFNMPERDARIARTRLDKPFPSLEQVRHVIHTMPVGDAIQLRDRALVAFILLTVARNGAVVSFKLSHLDLAEGCLIHDAREVASKFGRSFSTWFFPVGDDVRALVEEWAGFLTRELLWAPSDPLFPSTMASCVAGRAFSRCRAGP